MQGSGSDVIYLKPAIEARNMVKSPGSKGRPAYYRRSAKNDPPVFFPNLPTLTSWRDGGKCPETITTATEYDARVQKKPVEVAEVGEKIAQGLYKNEDRTTTRKPVPASTRDVHARDTAASSSKRKLDRTSPESSPMAKRIHSTGGAGKEGQEKRSQVESADGYKYLKQSQLREECLSRSLPAGGGIQDLSKRLRLHDAARAQISTSQESVNEHVTSYTSFRGEPSDRYTHMLQKDLRKACVKRSLPVGLTKRDLRRCLRVYDAARALGLTPEESLEAQRATFQEHARSVSPGGSIEENAFGAAPKEAVEVQPLGKTSRESIVDNGQGPTSLESSEGDASPLTNSQTSLGEDIASSSATTKDSTQDSTQNRGTSDICPGPAATLNYAAMGQTELRSLCRSRSLRQHGFSAPRLRMALETYDRKLPEQANNAEVDVDAEHKTAKHGDASPASSPPVAFIDLDSSSQDGEIREQQTRSVVTSGRIAREEPVSGFLWTVGKGQRPPVSTDAQVEVRQRGSVERASAGIHSEKDPYSTPDSPRLVQKPPKRIGNKSSPQGTLYTKYPMSLQQPLVSLINLTIRDTKSSASESAHQETQMKTKPPSELALKMAEKEEFNARYATERPSWICCCENPGYELRPKQLADFSGNCFYHVSQLAQRGTFTMKEYQEYQTTQQALDRIASCLCQKPAVDHPEHQVTMTQGGFTLAQIWREQLTRRQSVTTFRPDMAAYRRKGILEVMHNVLQDFMIELSSRQPKRPLELWARVEAMAWFINTLPTSNEWHCFQDWKRPCHYIMLFGIALLTTIDVLLRQNIFKDKEPKVPNLGLVLALFIQCTWNSPSYTMNSFHNTDAYNSPFNNNICVNNENGWAAEVVSLADQHGVRITGIKNISYIVDRWRLRRKAVEFIEDQARKEQYAVLHSGETIPPIEATLASIADKAAETPAKRGTGQRTTVRKVRIST